MGLKYLLKNVDEIMVIDIACRIPLCYDGGVKVEYIQKIILFLINK